GTRTARGGDYELGWQVWQKRPEDTTTAHRNDRRNLSQKRSKKKKKQKKKSVCYTAFRHWPLAHTFLSVSLARARLFVLAYSGFIFSWLYFRLVETLERR
ncbi:MAG: hypothetical protein O7D30_12905, partial [Rickettsia endosymbiont of Ixodes persulcatus]|nr:hypothetical protein [Rickettsia endosymbiont of Ixodes persulcatus]